MATYGYIYIYMQHLVAQDVRKMSSQCNHNQEAGAYYTKLIQLWYKATQLLCRKLQC